MVPTLSVRNPRLLIVLDPEDGRLLWKSPAGLTQTQHDASSSAQGRILAFDNGLDTQRSRVIELDVLRKEVVWVLDSPRFLAFARCSTSSRVPGMTPR